MKKGTSTGVLDSFLAEICVGDEIMDAAGTHYTIDQFGRAKPLNGGNVTELSCIKGATIFQTYKAASTSAKVEFLSSRSEKKAAEPEMNEEEKNIHAMYEGVDAASDQMLVDQLRKRGYTVTCTKVVEKIVYEEVAL